MKNFMHDNARRCNVFVDDKHAAVISTGAYSSEIIILN